MSVTFSVRQFDPKGRLVAPAAAGADLESYEAGFANANAADILAELGLGPDLFGGAPICAFASLVTVALRGRLGRRSPKIRARTYAGGGGATITDLGRPEGYLERRLHDLALLTQRGRAAGATHICWG